MRKFVLTVLAIAWFSATVQAEPQPASAPAVPPAATDPGNPPVRYDWQGNHKKAQAALNARDYKTAIQIFTEIIASGRLPKTWIAPTYYFRGKAYRSSKQYPLAITDYETAIQADPKMDIAFFELGATLHSTGQYGKAVNAFSQAIAIKNDAWNYFNGRCAAYAFLNKYRDAIQDCERAVRLKPGSSELLAFLGRLYEETGQKQRAVEYYRQALAINPNNTDASEGLKLLSK